MIRGTLRFHRRRGMTLVEILLASTITALTATAGATMMYGVAQASTQTRDNRVQRQAGHYALNCIGRVVREARAIGFVTSNKVALWVSDSNGNDQVDLQELGRIRYVSAKSIIAIDYFDTGGKPADVSKAPSNIFSDELLFDSKIDVTGMKSITLAEGVTSAAFAGYPTTVESRIVSTRFTMASGDTTLTFLNSASPRAPGDYLFFNETQIAPDTRVTRPRRKEFSRWKGFGDLTSVTPRS